MVMCMDFDVTLQIDAGREHYSDEYLLDQLLKAVIPPGACGKCQRGWRNEPPAHPYPFDRANLLACKATKYLLQDFAEALVREGKGMLPHRCFREEEFAAACPQLTFMLEYGNSDSGYPLRQFFRDGQLVASQRMSLQWGEVTPCS